MRTKILTCRTLERELRLAMEKCGCDEPVQVLWDNHHDVPKRLRENIQKLLDTVEDADQVLLAFTLCGGSMVGLKTGNYQTVIPRVDDCLSLLMGSMDRRRQVLEGGFGLFVTEGWLTHEKSIPRELARIEEKYPPERARKLIRTMYGTFDSLNVIDTGAYAVEDILPQTLALAEKLKLRHRVVPGTTAYLEELLTGPWDPKRFVLIPPYTKVTESDVFMGSL